MITNDTKNILVAEDSMYFRVKLKDILENGGHMVRLTANGREAIAAIEQGPEEIDLLILDLHMPEVDGAGVLRWLGENGLCEKFPVLLVSTVYDEPERDLEDLKRLGVTAFMSKAFSPQQIILHANKLLFPDKASRGKNERGRVPVSIPVDFSTDAGIFQGFILNMSDTGVYLKTETGIRKGSTLRLKFSLPESERVYELDGIVQWTTSEFAIKTEFTGGGVMFTNITDGDQEAFRAFVDREAKRLGLEE